MAISNAVWVLCVLFSLSYVSCEVEDLHPLIKSTEDTLQKAKTHVDHMLSLSPLPHEDKLPPIIKSESSHLAYEIKKVAKSLHEKEEPEQVPQVLKDAVTAAVTHLNEAAASLEHVGSDLKQDNIKYYEAADKLVHEIKNIVESGPCPEITGIIKGALNELAHDVNNYQYGIHDVIGPHEGGPTDTGHHESHGHHAHSHHGHSSEESNESNEKSSNHHHHHNHHHH